MERPFAHQFVTGGLRRIFVRGHANVRKRLLIHVCGFNLGLLMRHLTGVGTPRSLQSRAWMRLFTFIWGIIYKSPETQALTTVPGLFDPPGFDGTEDCPRQLAHSI